MNRPRNFAPRALRDLEEAARWLVQDGRQPVAERLLAAVLEAAERIADKPLLGRLRPSLLPPPYRFWSLTTLPYLLVYDPSQTPARILRLLHTSRDLPKVLTDLER